MKKIIIDGDKAKIQYHLPMPPDGKRTQEVEVLPMTWSLKLCFQMFYKDTNDFQVTKQAIVR